MGKLIQFWQKDIINKFIVLVALVIILTLGTLIYLLVTLPGGQFFLASFNPTATLSVDEIFRRGEETSTAEAVQTRTAIIPTITTMAFTPLVRSPTPSETPSATAAVLSSDPTQTPSAAPTSTPTLGPSSTPTRKPISISGDCPPRKNEQVGKVLEVVDGNTIRVLIDDLVYVVRYIGVDVPQDPNYAELSRFINADIVYAKEIKLYAEGTPTDESNRLLRYVVVGDSILVNQELIRRGLATAATSAYACAEEFSTAEQDAKTAQSGMWMVKQP